MGVPETQRGFETEQACGKRVSTQSDLLLCPQDQKIFIYNLKGMCPLNTPQRALDTPAVVTCFLAVPVLKKVRYGERGCTGS